MKRITIVIVSFIFITASITYPLISAVIIEDGESGRLLALFKDEPEQDFSVKYIHSIHKTPVLETYHTNKMGAIVQTEIQFEEFGVGMPSGTSGNEIFTQKDGTYILSNMNRVFPSLDIRIGQIIANHQFIIDGDEYPFSDFAKKGSWVRVKTKKINVWQWVIGGEKLGKK
jgi:hypothetical protein